MEIIFPEITPIPLGLRAFAKRAEDGNGEPRFRNSRRTLQDATYKVETYFDYTSNGRSTPVPCTVKFVADKKTKMPYKAVMVTPLGRAVIILTPDERGIPLPTSIYFHAHDYISSQISYKDPLMLRARLGSSNNLQEPDSDEIRYDPEEGYISGGILYNPEEGFALQQTESHDDEHNLDNTSNSEVVQNDSPRGDFLDLQRFYIVSKRPHITELVPHTEYRDGNPHVVYGPETREVRSDECIYSKEVQKGMWVAVTPQNSEVENRANFEERMLRFHIYAFSQVAQDSIPRIINLLKEDESISQN